MAILERESLDNPVRDDWLESLATVMDCITEDGLRKLTRTTAATTESWRRRGDGPPYVLIGKNYLYPVATTREWLHSRVRKGRTGNVRPGDLL